MESSEVEVKKFWMIALFSKAIVLITLSSILSESPSLSQGSALPTSEDSLAQGFALRAQGNTTDAYAAFDQAIRRSPNYADAYVAKAGLLFKQGRSIEAIVTYDQALSLNPNLVAAYLGKGQALARQGKRSEAREFLKSAEKTFRDRGDRQQVEMIRHLLPGL